MKGRLSLGILGAFLFIFSLAIAHAASGTNALYRVNPNLHEAGIYYYWCQGQCAFLMCNPMEHLPTSGYSFDLGSYHVEMYPLTSRLPAYKVLVNGVYCGNLVPPEGMPCPVASFSTDALSLVFYNFQLVNASPLCMFMLFISIPSPNETIVKTLNKTPVQPPGNTSIFIVTSNTYNKTYSYQSTAKLSFTITLSQPTACGKILMKSGTKIEKLVNKTILTTVTCTQNYQLEVPQSEIDEVTELLKRYYNQEISYQQLLQYHPRPIGKPRCESREKVLADEQSINSSTRSILAVFTNPGYVLFGNAQSSNTYTCCKPAQSSPGGVLPLAVLNRTFIIVNYTPMVAVANVGGKEEILSMQNITRLLQSLQSLAKANKGSLSFTLVPANGTNVLKYSVIDPKCSVALLNVYINLSSREAKISFIWNFNDSSCQYSGYKTCIFKVPENVKPYPTVNITVNVSETKLNISNLTSQDLVLGCLHVKYIRGNEVESVNGQLVNKTINQLILEGLGCSDFLHCCQGTLSQCQQAVQCPANERCLEIASGLVKLYLHGALGVDEIIARLGGFNYTVVFSNGQVTNCFSKPVKLKDVQQEANQELSQLQAILKHQSDSNAITPVSIYIGHCASILIKNKVLVYRYTADSKCPFDNLPTMSFVSNDTICRAYITQDTDIGKVYTIDCGFLKINYNQNNLEICSNGKCESARANIAWIFLTSDNGWKIIYHNSTGTYTSGKVNYQLSEAASSQVCNDLSSGAQIYIYQDPRTGNWYFAVPLPNSDTANYLIQHGASNSVEKINGSWYLVFSRAIVYDEASGNAKILSLKDIATKSGAAVIGFVDPMDFAVRVQPVSGNLYKLVGVSIYCDPNTGQWKILLNTSAATLEQALGNASAQSQAQSSAASTTSTSAAGTTIAASGATSVPAGGTIVLKLISTEDKGGETIVYSGNGLKIDTLGGKLPDAAKSGISVTKNGSIVYGKPQAYISSGRMGAITGAATSQFSFPFLTENVYELLGVIIFVALLIFRLESNEKNKN